MPTDSPQQPNSIPRKGMRKGTRSCYECRIRKIRCLFAKDATICEGCTSRGKRCTEQRRELLQEAALDNRESLRARIARLEAVIQASNIDVEAASTAPRAVLSVGAGTGLGSSSSTSIPTPASIPTPNSSVPIDKDSPQSIDPIVTLFDNAIVSTAFYVNSQLLKNTQWRRRLSGSAPDPTSRVDEAGNPAAVAKHVRTREALLSGLIPSELLGMILSATCSWWHTW